MYTIFCDESWSGHADPVPFPCYVFYGVLIQDGLEDHISSVLNAYKQRRGLWTNDVPVEIKWANAAEEAKSAAKSGLKNRLEGYLDCFFELMRTRQLSFGYLYLSVEQYAHVEPLFMSEHGADKHSFFFMLYFQFLYHCFMKTQIRHNPTRIFIDDRNMGAEGVTYDAGSLRTFLNKRLYREAAPQFQLPLSAAFTKQLEESIEVVDLASSKSQPIIQLSDLCAGCVRFSLENRLGPPTPAGQLSLFGAPSQERPSSTPRASLAEYFYASLRAIQGYSDIDLAKPSYHHRFSIFPFQFQRQQ
jgi:hypothetical protein